MVGDRFVLPDRADGLTEAERALVLAVVDELLAKQGSEPVAAPVISLSQFRQRRVQ